MSNSFDFASGDSLDDLLDAPARPFTPRLPADFVPAAERFTEGCPSCRGTGRFISWSGRDVGPCFKCKGAGQKTFKTAPAVRAQARAQAAVKREWVATKSAEGRALFNAANKAEVAWIAAQAERQHRNAHQGKTVWNFPISLAEQLAKDGSLSDPQLDAVRRCIRKDEARAAEAGKAQDAAPVCDASKIAQAFARATEAAESDGEGVRDLRLRLDTFVFSPAFDGGPDIWVKDREGGKWVGKIVAGKFVRFRACTDEQQARVLAAAADPAAAARAFGQRFTSCSCCGRELTNAKSRELGIGPICAEKWGL
jgi:hypothetical protein